jgi:hypothetical protein
VGKEKRAGGAIFGDEIAKNAGIFEPFVQVIKTKNKKV